MFTILANIVRLAAAGAAHERVVEINVLWDGQVNRHSLAAAASTRAALSDALAVFGLHLNQGVIFCPGVTSTTTATSAAMLHGAKTLGIER